MAPVQIQDTFPTKYTRVLPQNARLSNTNVRLEECNHLTVGENLTKYSAGKMFIFLNSQAFIVMGCIISMCILSARND